MPLESKRERFDGDFLLIAGFDEIKPVSISSIIVEFFPAGRWTILVLFRYHQETFDDIEDYH